MFLTYPDFDLLFFFYFQLYFILWSDVVVGKRAISQHKNRKCPLKISSVILREKYQTRSFSWSLFSRIPTEYRKYGPEETPYLDAFHEV